VGRKIGRQTGRLADTRWAGWPVDRQIGWRKPGGHEGCLDRQVDKEAGSGQAGGHTGRLTDRKAGGQTCS
jgi:hypothetical protein